MKRATRFEAGALRVVALLLTHAVLAGCRGAGETAGSLSGVEVSANASEGSATQASTTVTANPLSGTDWRLVDFQSMDDTIGTVRPDDPSLYTMRLSGDGTLSMRLNCNHATGTWSAEPSSDGSSGHFRFGPLAATRASCPPPSMDESMVAQAEFIRSYVLKDGRLYLSLMADGGIYAWEPHAAETNGEAGVPFETKPDADIEAAILRASPSYERKVIGADARAARYVYARVDLNGDQKPEVLVYLLGSIFCGTGGCDLLLLTEARGGYALLNRFSTSRLPVFVSSQRTAGWNELSTLQSGGGAPASYVRHVFNGKKYVEQERMSAEGAPEGTRYLAGHLSFDQGIPLEPRD